VIYIKRINGDIVQLGGEVATPQMMKDGWFAYDGPTPKGKGPHFKLINGVLEEYEPEISKLSQLAIYKEYLDKTDHKMLPGYEPKERENLEDIIAKRSIARAFVRECEAEQEMTRRPPL